MIKDGQINCYEQEGSINAREVLEICCSNINRDPDTNRIFLISIDDDEETVLEFDGEDDTEDWYDAMVVVGHRWGPLRQRELEHEIAGMRKTIGSLYEFMAQGSEIPNSNKRIENLTCDIEIKDSKLGDLGAILGNSNSQREIQYVVYEDAEAQSKEI